MLKRTVKKGDKSSQKRKKKQELFLHIIAARKETDTEYRRKICILRLHERRARNVLWLLFLKHFYMPFIFWISFTLLRCCDTRRLQLAFSLYHFVFTFFFALSTVIQLFCASWAWLGRCAAFFVFPFCTPTFLFDLSCLRAYIRLSVELKRLALFLCASCSEILITDD